MITDTTRQILWHLPHMMSHALLTCSETTDMHLGAIIEAGPRSSLASHDKLLYDESYGAVRSLLDCSGTQCA